jgi:hypothetical protein
MIRWAANDVGEQCAHAVQRLLISKPHPEQGYRACLGIMRLARQYGVERLEAACERAVRLDACSYRRIKSMLATSADRQPLPEPVSEVAAVDHHNLRGKEYYR